MELLFYYKDGKRIVGANPALSGDPGGLIGDTTNIHGVLDKLKGDTSFLSGNISGITGDLCGTPYSGVHPWSLCGNVSNIFGDITEIHGDVSGISGYVGHLDGDVSNLSGDMTPSLLGLGNSTSSAIMLHRAMDYFIKKGVFTFIARDKNGDVFDVNFNSPFPKEFSHKHDLWCLENHYMDDPRMRGTLSCELRDTNGEILIKASPLPYQYKLSYGSLGNQIHNVLFGVYLDLIGGYKMNSRSKA